MTSRMNSWPTGSSLRKVSSFYSRTHKGFCYAHSIFAFVTGPLFSTDAAHQKHLKAIATLASSKAVSGLGGAKGEKMLEKLRLLSELDAAAALGLSEKEARKQLLKEQIAPFDIVEEFNRSFESWVVAANPAPAMIRPVLSQVATFFAEFSQRSKPPPTFLRLGIDIATLGSFGIDFEELRIVDGAMSAKQSMAVQEEEKAVASTTDLVDANMFPTSQQVLLSSLKLLLRIIVFATSFLHRFEEIYILI